MTSCSARVWPACWSSGFDIARQAGDARQLVALVREVRPELVIVDIGSSRGAIYKMMFDARRKLRAALAANGYMDHDTAGSA